MKMMRLPSRLMKPRPNERFGPLIAAVSSAVVVGLGYFVHVASGRTLVLAALFVCAIFLWAVLEIRREMRRLAAIANARQAESICDFARTFERRTTDTWIIRAVYEELQLALSPSVNFPLRASDSMTDDLRLDPDDVEDVIVMAAARSNRVLEQTERNPYYGRIDTASDLVLFLHAQPRMTAN